MGPRTFAISDTFAIRGRGTALCTRLGPDDILRVGMAVDLLRPDGGTFASRVKAVEAFMVSPPPEPGTVPAVGVMLADDPGPVPAGSALRPAP